MYSSRGGEGLKQACPGLGALNQARNVTGRCTGGLCSHRHYRQGCRRPKTIDNGDWSGSTEITSCPLPLDHSRLVSMFTKYKKLSNLLTFPAWRNVKYQHRRGAYCPWPMLLFYIPPCRKTFPAWRNVIYQHRRGKKCSGTNRVFSHSQNCNFPEESFVLSTFCSSVQTRLS